MLTKQERKRWGKLLRPYARGNKRTLDKQYRWLKEQYMLTDDIIYFAMKILYHRIGAGKKFENGHELDRYLLELCRAIRFMKEEQKLEIEQKNIKLKWWQRVWKQLNISRGYYK